MNERERIRRTFSRPAVVEIDREFRDYMGSPRIATEWQVERYIWRSEDVPSYRVALGEALNTAFTNTDRRFYDIQTRMLEYVPTGRIIYDNTRAPMEAVLFEYRLKVARDTQVSSPESDK